MGMSILTDGSSRFRNRGRAWKMLYSWLLIRSWGDEPRKCGQLLEAGRDEEMDFPLEPTEETQSC